MRKKIAFITILMCVCAASACGQATESAATPAPETQKETYAATETAVEESTSSKNDFDPDSETESNKIDIPAYSSDKSDLYTYDLHGGIKISCRTNVWDYIDGNSFDFRAMAHDLGFTNDLNNMPECHGFTHDFDGENVIVGFAGDERTNLSDPYFPLVCITAYSPKGGTRELAVNYCFDTGAEYTINGSGPRLSFDSIPIVAYILENFSLDNKDPFKDMFEAYKVPKEQKTVSWKEYRLP